MRRVRVNIHNEQINMVIKKENKENVSMVNNIISKRETKR